MSEPRTNRTRQFAIYKGKSGKWGAAQFDFKPAQFGETFKDDEDGVVFLSITSASAPDIYDWSKETKIVFALSHNDLAQVVLALRTTGECSLMHDPGAGSASARQVTKQFNLSSPKGLKAGCMLSVAQKRGDAQVRHTVPLSPHE